VLTIRGRHYLTGDVCDIHLAGGLIQDIVPPMDNGAPIGGDEYWVAPGLLDIQVNGYRGHDFCSKSIAADEVVAVAEKLTEAGVTGFCPTVTTNTYAAMEASVRAIADAYDRSPLARERILGIHLEGPYISPLDGPRGAHPRDHVRHPDWDEFMRLQEAARGHIKVVTIAPELPGALSFIHKACRVGVVIALGHHAATREQIHAATVAGAILCTHLGNGAHSQLPRHPNYIWDQLAHDGLMASIIVDGHHLPPAVVKCFYRIKGSSRLILVSDAISAAGLSPGRYQFMGMDIQVMEDESVRLSGTPYLAGSTLKLCKAVTNMMRLSGASLAEAITMAASNPARLLGMDRERGFLRVGQRADLILLRESAGYLDLMLTVAGGQVCYQTL
jgi:N-acetylglucosamine-6-phosphate deacetylase